MDCRRIAGCRACGDGDLRSILDLGWQRLAGRFPGPDEPDPPGFPLELLRCNGGCGLVQLSHTVRPDLQFRDYYYRSAISDTMRGHLRGLAVEASGKVHDEPGLSRRVLDIGCFPAGEVITQDYAPLEISCIRQGDRVLARDGRFTSVTRTFSRHYSGDLVRVFLRGMQGGQCIRATPEHPFLVVRGIRRALSREDFGETLRCSVPEWVPADRLEEGDYCLLPETLPPVTAGEVIRVSDWVPRCRREGDVAVALQKGRDGSLQRAHNQNPVRDEVPLDEAFGRLLGYYIAEGSGDGESGSFSFAFHEEEGEYVCEVMGLLVRVLGLNSSSGPGTGRSTVVQCSSAVGKRFFRWVAGYSAAGKELPGFVFSAPRDFCIGLLRGMFRGDGSFTAGCWKYDTVSKKLAVQLRFLLASFGVDTNLVPNAPNGYGDENGLTLWSVRAGSRDSLSRLAEVLGEDFPCGGEEANNKWPKIPGYRLIRIRALEKEFYEGPVYNFETEDHSYVMESAVVHNCNDGTLLGYTPFGHGRRYGIDPCGLPVDGEGIVCHCGYFPDDVPRGWPSFDLIFSVACFYDVDDPVIFAEAVRDSLTPDGLWCIEVAHLPDVVGLASYDTVLHEHLCYYDLETLHFVLSMAGLRVVDHSFNTCNNGTLRVWAARGVRGLGGVRTEYDWPAFAARVRAHKAELLDYLDSCRRQGKRVHLLGASAKANTVLQYCGIDPDLVQAASDRDPRKRGHRTPGSGIPILSEADSRATHPDVYLTVLTHFRDELIERERAAGFRGQFVFALPSLEVVQL